MIERRLGLFGGTFDPPHNGHVAALVAAWRSGRYRAIEVTVSNESYRKTEDRSVTEPHRRLALAHAAFDGLDGVTVSDREIRRGGPSYTIDTVDEIADPSLELIVGQDAAADLGQWRDAARLATLVTVGVVPRDGAPALPGAPWRCTLLTMAPVDLSSTALRAQLARGETLAGLVPAAVMHLLESSAG